MYHATAEKYSVTTNIFHPRLSLFLIEPNIQENPNAKKKLHKNS